VRKERRRNIYFTINEAHSGNAMILLPIPLLLTIFFKATRIVYGDIFGCLTKSGS
jgi:hypothetical protein